MPYAQATPTAISSQLSAYGLWASLLSRKPLIIKEVSIGIMLSYVFRIKEVSIGIMLSYGKHLN
ncbi:hypothetical protein LYNGBM3L_07410 [Moorena producens 3L]|uniref:Uncharacterized protein n=1 Tax=Moorena producens 3L TaxID=489825 RepID=F4XJ99_9CYAN|nr:hypothetical protein LYNGBM3L_07410 [Moorena producens 3L]